MESQTRLMSWYWKRKPTWRKDLIRYNSHPWIIFFLIDWLSFRDWMGEERSSFEVGRPRSRWWKNFDVAGQSKGGSWQLDNFHERPIHAYVFFSLSIHFWILHCIFKENEVCLLWKKCTLWYQIITTPSTRLYKLFWILLLCLVQNVL